ncbi:MAG: excinuclease ABC subunit UvrC [Symploca sp. SIO1A3]|nr:excinuclease ABC subunit UvrC [Symploca sp. SIO1A3]
MMTPTQTLPLVQNPERLESCLKEIPAEPGVYLMRDNNERILYIGKSKKLRSRVRSYFRESQPLSERIARMVRQVVEIEFIVTDTEAEALALEANLVKQHQPYFNVLLKDDKKYPYILITWSEQYPRILITRKRRLGKAKDKYYGPFVDGRALRSTLQLVKRLFPVRQRPRPLFKDRPCLNYDIGHCPGVCQQLITPEDYCKTIQKIAMVFQGRTEELITLLTSNMEQAAEALNFELAARIRDQIAGLQSLNADQKVALPDDTVSRDAIALAADDQHACIQLFQIRAGRLVGRLGFFAEIPSQAFDVGAKNLGDNSPNVGAKQLGNNSPNVGAKQLGNNSPNVGEKHLSDNLSTKPELDNPNADAPYVANATLTPSEILPLLRETLAGAILQRVLEEHYYTAEAVEIPAEILVQYPLPEGEILAAYLSDRKSRKVNILTPQRQSKAELIEMVERNANYELERSQRFADRNTQAMQDLANILNLPYLPRRIEGYDISHIQGSNAVASQVVFIDGTPAKQHYRHYKIQNPDVTIGHSDDFASLAEVIRRRFRKYGWGDEGDKEEKGDKGDKGTKEIFPIPNSQFPIPDSQFPNNKQQTTNVDLVMIDGGKGQLSAVVAVLQELNLLEDVPVVSLAKQREEIFLPGESSPLATNPEQPGVQLLRRLRDEAHRFAVSFHRQQRTNKLRRSRLDDIPGLGFHRQKQLLAHFHSIDYIRAASVEQLTEVAGIGPSLAQQIYDYFHP